MEIQRELLAGETLGLPSAPNERVEIDGNRANWPKLRVGYRVLVRWFFPGERTETLRSPKSIQYIAVSRTVMDAGGSTQ
jgi:hypothetical protein